MNLLRRLTYHISRNYQPDFRALALMRIAVALVLIADLLIRLTDLRAHYSDEGLWPTELAKTLGWKAGYWSMHTWTGAVPWQQILFALQLLAATGLLLGYRTTLSTFVSWYLLVSLHNRNLFILQAGDDLLRLVLFIGIFLPWQRHYSLDRNRRPFFPPNIFIYLAYLLLTASVYIFSVLLKSGSEWWSEGTAIYYALSLEQLRLPHTGDWLWRHEHLLKWLTWVVILMETLIGVLLLWPGRRGRGRNVAFFLLVALHTGIACTLYVGLFPFIASATAIGVVRFPRQRREASLNFFSDSKTTIATGSFAVAVITMCLIINLEGLPRFPFQLHRWLQVPAGVLRLDQYWGMFSPSVLKNDGWFVYQGIDGNGKAWDLRLDREVVEFSKPPRILSMYANDRWRKLAENMTNDSFTFLRLPFARYVLREWNRLHPEKTMAYLHLYYMPRINSPGYKSVSGEKTLYCVSDGR